MYKIEKIILNGYTRLQLGQIGHIELNFNARDQIIIGTNGCGKSSILYELSPLPADKDNYEKTGRKEIHITKDGKSIIATSTFNPKPFHSFILDGEELNESGLITIQKELAEKYTGITAEIHELMMGKISFTTMRANDRREWFTKLSDVNYEYLIGVYLKFKEITRDITGALRQAKSKLVTETSKAIKDDELKTIRNDVEKLYELIEYLAERRMPIEQNVDQLMYTRQGHLENLDNISNSIIKVFKQFGNNSDFNPATIQSDLIESATQIRLYKLLEEEFFIKHKEQSVIFDILEKTKLESVAKLSTDITDIRKEINNLTIEKVFSFTHNNPADALNTISAITKDVSDIVNNIAKNPERAIYNKSNFDELNSKVENKTKQINVYTQKITEIETLINHAKEHKQEDHITCPKCNYLWLRGITTEDLNNLQKQLRQHHIDKESCLVELKVLNEDQARFRLYADYLKNFRDLVSFTNNLSDFWNYISNEKLIELKPSSISNLLVNYSLDIKKDIKIKQLNHELNEKLKLLELTNNNKDHDYNTVKNILDELNNKIHINNLNLSKALVRQDKLSKINNTLTILETRKKDLEQLLSTLDTNTAALMENHRRQAFNAILRNLQSILAGKERILQESINQINLIKSLEEEILNLTENEKALKTGLKVMSPTEGLIAKGLYGFMQVFIRNMNAVIGKIWSYPFTIKPCNSGDSENIDLTYRFPMVVNGHEGKHKDVSEGSTAMLEVVDIAFRICALKALRMSDTPLFLDEFGKTMDSVHRRATTNLINTLMEEDSFTQMFLISHDISQYGALSNCDICVLEDSNVILPANSVYNKHVVMY